MLSPYLGSWVLIHAASHLPSSVHQFIQFYVSYSILIIMPMGYTIMGTHRDLYLANEAHRAAMGLILLSRVDPWVTAVLFGLAASFAFAFGDDEACEVLPNRECLNMHCLLEKTLFGRVISLWPSRCLGCTPTSAYFLLITPQCEVIRVCVNTSLAELPLVFHDGKYYHISTKLILFFRSLKCIDLIWYIYIRFSMQFCLCG